MIYIEKSKLDIATCDSFPLIVSHMPTVSWGGGHSHTTACCHHQPVRYFPFLPQKHWLPTGLKRQPSPLNHAKVHQNNIPKGWEGYALIVYISAMISDMIFQWNHTPNYQHIKIRYLFITKFMTPFHFSHKKGFM